MSFDTSSVAGIDLGTTNSCICVYRNGRIEVVANENGKRTSPSVVSFTPTGRFLGFAAKQQATRNFKNTVFDVKRMIGLSYDSEVIQKEKKRWPFQVVSDENGRPKINVSYMGEEKSFKPEEISAMVLTDLVNTAKKCTNCDIRDIVITVPAYFNDNQRQATKDAGTIAGYNVLCVLNEPTAAAIAYGFENADRPKNILVYDLGGGTFDVTILSVNERKFSVIGTGGDTHLGGDDFDYLMMDIINDALKKNGIEVREDDKKTAMKIREMAEEVKINLSQMLTMDVEMNVYGEDATFSVTRDQFEEKARPYFEKSIEVVKSVLSDCRMVPDSIDEVVLVGGSSRIPYIKKLLSALFGESKIFEKINPDEAVAQGAVIEAVQKKMQQDNFVPEDESGSEDESSDDDDTAGYAFPTVEIAKISISDVVPLNLGIKNSEGGMSILIEKNTTFPCKGTRNYVTSKDNQTKMKVRVYQGNRCFAKDNYEVGVFYVEGITPLPRQEASIDLTMSMDTNGILICSAIDKTTGKETKVCFNKESTNLSMEEILKMKQEAIKMKEFDELQLARQTLYNDIENCMYTVQRAIESTEAFDEAALSDAQMFIEGTKKFLENRDASLEELQENAKVAEEWVEMMVQDEV